MKTRRLFLLEHEGQNSLNRSITVQKGRPWKHSFKAYLPSSTIHDKLTAIDVEVRYSMAENSRSRFSSRRRNDLKPVLGQRDLKAKDTMLIAKDCGVDGRCVPNLSVDAEINGAYVIGAGEKLEIIAKVDNEGEDAFNAMLYVQIPQGVNFINADSSNSVSVLCSPPTMANNRTLKCEIGNPLPPYSQVQIKIFLQPSESNQNEYLSEYEFFLAVNSSNPEAGFSQQSVRVFSFLNLNVIQPDVKVVVNLGKLKFFY